jgi:DNA-binding CsgD family transcriptional regulator
LWSWTSGKNFAKRHGLPDDKRWRSVKKYGKNKHRSFAERVTPGGRRKKRTLKPSEVREVCDLYRYGFGPAKIKEMLDRSLYFVQHCLKEGHEPPKKSGRQVGFVPGYYRALEERNKEIIKSVNEGYSTREVAAEYGLSRGRVQQIVRNNHKGA